MNQPDYIESREGGYWIRGTRVSLDSVVYRFLEGLSPETIQGDCFPTLTLDQVYGAISYYLANRDEIDRCAPGGMRFELNLKSDSTALPRWFRIAFVDLDHDTTMQSRRSFVALMIEAMFGMVIKNEFPFVVARRTPPFAG